jgi:hypothetical protein
MAHNRIAIVIARLRMPAFWLFGVLVVLDSPDVLFAAGSGSCVS